MAEEPYRSKRRRTTATPPTPEPSLWDRIGGLPGAAATGVRGLSGLLGASGGIPGAIAGGGGEILAQGIEALGGLGSDQTWGQRAARVGTEASLGAVPFRGVAKPGQALFNLLRGGALSGVGDVARQASEQGTFVPELDLGRTTLATGIGGGATAGGQKLIDKLMGSDDFDRALAATQTKTARARAPQIETTAHPGGTEGFGKNRAAVRPPRPIEATPQEPLVGGISPSFQRFEDLADTLGVPRQGPIEPVRAPGVVSEFDPTEFDAVMGTGGSGIPYGGASAQPSRASQRSAQVAARAQNTEWAQEARNMNAAQKAQAEIDRAKAIQAARREAGAEAQEPTFSESLSAPTPEGGRQSMSTRYVVPKEEEASRTGALLPVGHPLAVTPEVPSARAPGTPELDLPLNPAVLAEAAPAEPLGEIARFFRSRGDAAGTGYREAKAAGDVPRDVLGRVHGRALQREGTPGTPTTTQRAVPQEAAIDETTLRGIQSLEEAQAAERAAFPGGVPPGPNPGSTLFENIKRLLSSESGGGSELGAASPEILAMLTGGALGGLTGVAAAPEDQILLGGLGGAAIGAGLPLVGGKILSRELPDVVGGLKEAFQSVPEARESIIQLMESIPNAVRSNLLTSFRLPANTMGSYGAAGMAGLEEGLVGDPRGWEILRNLGSPAKFVREMGKVMPEARDLVRRGELGRAEFGSTGNALNTLQELQALPADLMTAGDLVGKNIIRRSGFPEQFAQKATLTAQPELPGIKDIVQWGRSGLSENPGDMERIMRAAVDTTLPFKRTPANIVEQGLERLPILGLLQLLGDNPDMKRAIVQQSLGIPLAAVGGAAGYFLPPEQSKYTTNTLSNLSGRFSLGTGLASGIGRGMRQAGGIGNISPGERATIAGRAIDSAVPLPSLDILKSILGVDPGSGKIPRGVLPGAIEDLNVLRRGVGLAPPKETPRARPGRSARRRRSEP